MMQTLTLQQIKSKTPWWTKILAKIVLSRLPIPYDFWRRIGLFKHGNMDKPEQAISSFDHHYRRFSQESEDKDEFTALEIGPGDSIASGIIAKAYGAKKTYLVDNGYFIQNDLEPYIRLIKTLRSQHKTLPDLEGCKDIKKLMSACDIVYMTEGLKSLQDIPGGEVDFFWSQVVLEHIRRSEFDSFIQELYRIGSSHAFGSHSVDLRDHLGGALNNCRFSKRRWESRLFSHSGFYTNRLRYSQMIDSFKSSGFVTEITSIMNWESLPTKRKKLNQYFHQFSDDELCIKEFEVTLRKESP